MKTSLAALSLVALAASVGIATEALGQAPLFTQQMMPGGGTLRTSSYWIDPTGENDSDLDSQAWEDFMLAQTAEVSRVRWWGQALPPLGFWVEFYNQDPNTTAVQPHIVGAGSGPIAEEYFPAPSVQSVGGGLYEFTIDLATPLTFEADTRYFVSVIGQTVSASATWSWAQGEGAGTTFWWSRGFHMYFSLAGNRAMELSGTVIDVPCPADFTGPSGAGSADGQVDALDFLLLIAQWGSPCAGSCEADITGPTPLVPDGDVDALDFLLLISQWGSPGNC